MMERTLLKDIPKHIGHEIKIQGFINKVRDQKKMQFIIVRDHTGVIQAALERTDINRPLNLVISALTSESAVEVTGTLVENPAIKLGGVEIQIKGLKVASLSESMLPIDITNNTDTELDKRLDWRFLDLRRPENLLIFQIQTTAEMAMREFWIADGFVEIHSPKFLGAPSESGAELFAVEYFGKTAYLAQSPQFYKQMAMAAGFNKVFEIGPVFRANPSFTTRHDTEFTSVDVEISWVDSHYEVMVFEERWLQHIIQTVKEKHGRQIKETFGTDIVIPSIPFPKISMEDAQKILGNLGHIPPPDTKEGDLDPQGEKLLYEYVSGQYNGHEFVFVIDYPVSIRPFYHMRYENAPAKTKSFDLFWKGLEVTTGAQREHRYDVLCKQALEKGLRLEPIQFYLDFFKFGCPSHGGHGFGLTRMLMVMLNRNNVREVTYLYRGPNRLTP
jgi:nondiscriminating aspartyl-tRNA synthetase